MTQESLRTVINTSMADKLSNVPSAADLLFSSSDLSDVYLIDMSLSFRLPQSALEAGCAGRIRGSEAVWYYSLVH